MVIIKTQQYKWNIKRLRLIQDKIKEGKKYNIFDRYNYLQNYPTFYINLDRSTDRNELMKSQLELYDVNYSRVSAINGKKIISKTSGTVDNQKYINDYPNIKTNEIACTLSHIKAIREAYKTNKEYSIIMEDDCLLYLLPYWEIDIEFIIKNAPEDFGIIQLYTISDYCVTIGNNNMKKGILYTKFDMPCYSTAVYLISRKGMKDVLDYCGYDDTYILRKNKTDGIADTYIYSLTNTYYFSIPIFLTADHEYRSTIQNITHTYMHLVVADNIINIYNSTNRIFMDELLNYNFDYMETLYKLDKFMKDNNIEYILMKETALLAYRDMKYNNSICIGVYELSDKLYNVFDLVRENKINENIISLSYIDKNSISINIIIINNNKYFSDSNREIDVSDMNIESIDFFKKRYNIFSPEKYFEAEYGTNWYIPKSINSKINYKIYPRMVKESDKKIIWCYFNEEKYRKNYDMIYDKYKEKYDVYLLDNDMYKIISRRNNDNNIENINPISIRNEYMKYSIIEQYGGICIDMEYADKLDNYIEKVEEELKKYKFVKINNNNFIIGGKEKNRVSQKYMDIFSRKYGKWKVESNNYDKKKYDKFIDEVMYNFIDKLIKLYMYELKVL